MIEVTLIMEKKDDPKDVKQMKVLVNPEAFQMVYAEEEKCTIIFSNGRSIVAEESYTEVRDMIHAIKPVLK